MKLFSFASRPKENATQIPHVRVDVAHLLGPGKIRADHDHLLFEADQNRQLRLDVQGLNQIIAYGEIVVTGAAMRLLEQHSISMTWLNSNGSFVLGRLAIESSERSLMRLLQFQAWDDDVWQLSTSRGIVLAKVAATESAVRHYQRQGKQQTKDLLPKLQLATQSSVAASSVDQLRGIEGNVAALWYKNYGGLFGKNWAFKVRTRRPPLDPINALLSLGYMQLYRRVAAHLEARGYEATLGALHEFRPGRLSLACDLMEPLRIPAVDRWVLAICQQGIVRKEEFTKSEKTGVRIDRNSLPKVLGRFEEHWHQGFFQQQLDSLVVTFANGLREHVSNGTTRAAAYLKRRAINSQAGPGNSQTYEP